MLWQSLSSETLVVNSLKSKPLVYTNIVKTIPSPDPPLLTLHLQLLQSNRAYLMQLRSFLCHKIFVKYEFVHCLKRCTSKNENLNNSHLQTLFYFTNNYITLAASWELVGFTGRVTYVAHVATQRRFNAHF